MAETRSTGPAIDNFLPADQPGAKVGNCLSFTVPLLLHLRFAILTCNRDVEGSYYNQTSFNNNWFNYTQPRTIGVNVEYAF